MGLTDDFNSDENKTGLSVVYMSVGVISFIILIVVIVLMVNKENSYSSEMKEKAKQNMNATEMEGEVSGDASLALGESALTSDQLDFWDMYREESSGLKDKKTISDNSYEAKAAKLREQEEGEDLSDGGTKTKVTLPDGSEEWVMINAYIPKNKYDYTGLVYQEPIMKYYENGNKISYTGVTVSQESGTVNFSQLKNAGIDFVMLRVGGRGYSTGEVTLDENFITNMTNAKAAGLKVGVTFFSQAITSDEAIEEADLVLANLLENPPDYPVVFDMEQISNDTARTDNLSKMQLTEITRVFCDRIAEAGYTPMIYGNKYWLLRKLDLTKLIKYEIWLDQSEDVPDYPYKFSIWQYKNNEKISGISGDAKLSVSFVNYNMR